jgi:hypothetical protein
LRRSFPLPLSASPLKRPAALPLAHGLAGRTPRGASLGRALQRSSPVGKALGDEPAGSHIPLIFGVCDFPKGFMGVLARQQKTADLPNRSALRLLTSVGY